MIRITVQVDGMACGMCEAHVNDAVRRSFFPGCRLEGDRTVVLETHDFMDVLRAVQFVL